MKRKMVIRLTSKNGYEFGFPFIGDTKYLDYWRKEGFEIDLVLNTVPDWAVNLGLTKVWCRVQDAWQFLRLW